MATTTAAYIRASTSAQAVSPLRQRELIEAWSAKTGTVITHWFTERPISGSAGLAERPELTKAIMSLKRNDALVVLDMTRLSRSQLVFNLVLGMLHQRKASLLFADGTTYEEDCLYSRLMMSVMSFASEWERQQISMRTKTALAIIGRTKALGGKNRHRFGYDSKNGLLVANEDEQRLGSRIQQMRKQGCKFREIQEALATEGITSRSNKPYSNAAIQRINRTFKRHAA